MAAVSEIPIGWRCAWLLLTDVPPFHLKPAHEDYPTRDLAEQKRRLLRRQFGEQIIANVTPVYLSRTARERRLAASQDNLAAAGWPSQHAGRGRECQPRDGRRSRQ